MHAFIITNFEEAVCAAKITSAATLFTSPLIKGDGLQTARMWILVAVPSRACVRPMTSWRLGRRFARPTLCLLAAMASTTGIHAEHEEYR